MISILPTAILPTAIKTFAISPVQKFLSTNIFVEKLINNNLISFTYLMPKVKMSLGEMS